MKNVIYLEGSSCLNNLHTPPEIYRLSDSELLEYIYPFNSNIDVRDAWFDYIGKQLSSQVETIPIELWDFCEPWYDTKIHAIETGKAKIKHIFYGNSKLTSIERIYFEDIARKKMANRPDPRQTVLYLRGCA